MFEKTQTFKVECFVPAGVQGLSLDLGLQLVFLVRHQCDPNVGVAETIGVPGRQVPALTSDMIYQLKAFQQEPGLVIMSHINYQPTTNVCGPLQQGPQYLNDLQLESLCWIFVLNVEVDVSALLAGLPGLVRVEGEQSEGAVLQETQLENTSESIKLTEK